MAKAWPARSLLASAVAATLAAPSAQAEWRFSPTVNVRETWSDNVSQAPSGQEQSQLVTTVAPGFTLSNDTPRLKLNANYTLNAYVYSGSHPSGTNSTSQNLTADAKAKLVGEELFLDANASIGQYTVSGFGPQATPGTGYSSNNSNEVRTIRISPYYVHNFGSLANLLLRYQYDRVTSDNFGLGQSNGNTLTASLGSGPTFRKIGWTLSYTTQSLDDTVAAHSKISNANLGLRYLMSPDLTLTASGGYDKNEYDSVGGSTQGAAWSAGFQWTPSSRTSVTANAGQRYFGPSYFLSAVHRSRSTVWNFSYNDSITNSRNQFTLPSAVNTSSLLDQLFSASIPDPVQRAAAVRAYIASAGLPSSLPNAVNYFSNRFELQRQFLASMSGKLAKASGLFSIYRTRREAVSNVNQDSPLLGSQNSLLNDNTDQKGISTSLSYNIGPRTQATVSATAYNVESLTTKRNDHYRQLSLYLSRQFASKLSGVAELRRNQGKTLATGAQKYTENAIALGLAMQF
jgi:uncharacterized protein (PEP-CTERM system associated)